VTKIVEISLNAAKECCSGLIMLRHVWRHFLTQEEKADMDSVITEVEKAICLAAEESACHGEWGFPVTTDGKHEGEV